MRIEPPQVVGKLGSQKVVKKIGLRHEFSSHLLDA
jgi:hypothetical protein